MTLVQQTILLLAAGTLLAGAAPEVRSETVSAATAAGHPASLAPGRVYDSRVLLSEVRLEEGTASLPELNGGAESKDPRRAMLYSLLVPGLGEYWLGHKTRASFFFVAETGIWTAYGVFQSQGSHRKELYREWAAAMAGVPVRDDDVFYRTISNFVSSDGPFSANEQVRREARAIFPNNRAAQEKYVEEHGFFGDDAWRWRSDDAFARFKEMRRRSLSAYNNGDLTLGLLVANRLVSIVDAALLAHRDASRAEEGRASLRWNLGAGPEGPGAKVVLSRTY